MSSRARVALLAAMAAAGAAALAVGGAIATREDRGGGKPHAGLPPLVLDLGVRRDPEATAFRRALALYGEGKAARAESIFLTFDSTQALVGGAVARWPNGSLAQLEGLAEERPRDPVVLLNLGIARIWSGDDAGGIDSLRRAATVAPDTLSAVRAGDLLHPELAPGLPTFVPDFGYPPGLERLPPPRQLRELERRARSGAVRDRLRYGIALQRLGHPLGAEREFAAAARAAPNDPEAQVAAAVGRFSKDDPSRAFSRLGPLTRRFPRAQTVRFHLGLLLLWIGRLDDARRQLTQAALLAPRSRVAREAERFLDRLEASGTGRP